VLPEVMQQAWSQNPIDRFILAKLEQSGLAPSPAVEKSQWLRRVTLDLTGLPPTLQDQAAFLGDTSPDAYETVVDRLLQTPAHAERMAMIWLDAARYADTNGYNNDEERVMWRWRDWVIDAFNRNQPYDQFVVEQLAGDMLPGATLEQKLATGFNRNHVLTTEGGIIEEEYRVEYVADRVQTTGSVFLGLTLQCARCHDHKYDPISQREYYQMFAFFNQAPDKVLGYNKGAPATPYLSAPTREQQTLVNAIAQEQTELKTRLTQREQEIEPSVVAWEAKLSKDDLAQQPPLGLAFHFPLDEMQGAEVQGTLQTSTASTAKGTVKGEPQWVAGKVGGALALNGATYIEAGNLAQFDRGDKITFSAWVNRTSDAAIAVLSKMQESNSYRGYDIMIEKGKVAMHLVHHWPDNGLKVITKTSFPMNEWRHLCVTYDGSSKAGGI